MSALGNALVVDSELPGPALLRALNGIAPEVFFRDAAPVDASFRVRRALDRTYRYWEPGSTANAEGYRQGTELLSGRVDVRSFGRGLSSGAPTWREVQGIRLLPASGGVWVEVVAPSFVWGMVRKLVSALRGLGSGTLDVTAVREAVGGRRRLSLPLAEPEPLVLWDVRFPLHWTVHASGFSRHQQRYWAEEEHAWRARGPVLRALSGDDRKPVLD